MTKMVHHLKLDHFKATGGQSIFFIQYHGNEVIFF
jgi:hypothetical protein